MIKLESSVNTKIFDKFSLKRKKPTIKNIMEKYGQDGVNSLSKATPVDTGKTASSWSYDIRETENGSEIVWLNSNRNDGALIVALIKYGHSTASGSWVKGNDFVTPAMDNILKDLVKELKTEVGKDAK